MCYNMLPYHAERHQPCNIATTTFHIPTIQKINGLLDKFIGEARVAYSIPEEAFNSYRVKRGLREADGTGITAGVTKIGNAHGYIIYEGERVPTGCARIPRVRRQPAC